MKLQASPAAESGAGWRETVREQRDAIAALIEDSPSLAQLVSDAIGKELIRARLRVGAALADHGEKPSADPGQLT